MNNDKFKYVEKNSKEPKSFQAYQFVTEVYKSDLTKNNVPLFLFKNGIQNRERLIEDLDIEGCRPKFKDYAGWWDDLDEGDYIFEHEGGLKSLPFAEFEHQFKPDVDRSGCYYISKEDMKEYTAFQIFKATADFLYEHTSTTIEDKFNRVMRDAVYGCGWGAESFLRFTRTSKPYSSSDYELGLEYKDGMYGNWRKVDSGDYLVYDHKNKTYNIYSATTFESRFVAKK